MWMPLKRLGTSCLTPRTANTLFCPWERGRIWPFLGRLFFLRPFGRMVQHRAAKNIYMFLAKKTAKKSKNTSKIRSDTGKGSHKHNRPDLWDRGSIDYASLLYCCARHVLLVGGWYTTAAAVQLYHSNICCTWKVRHHNDSSSSSSSRPLQLQPHQSFGCRRGGLVVAGVIPAFLLRVDDITRMI